MKTVLIAGGSGGIGSETARQAARAGWSVLIAYKAGRARAESVAAEIENTGGRALVLKLDLEEPSSIEEAVRAAAERESSLEALVLSACPPPVLAPFQKTEAEESLRQFKVGALGAQLLISACWRKFFYPARVGHVVGILSAAMGPPPWPHMSAYAAGKRAMQSMLESAASELGRSGLRVSALKPTYTETPMLTALPSHILDAARARMKAGRFLSAAEVAKAVVACLENPPAAGEFRRQDITEP
ncbi:MAG: SDR family oxidoreductase [Elusimicrobia bacterium]|nr:SDR family oxidoreductase [Elusimicrobiota bacterium]MDE2312877.1 SDR family oxidoreductase [Elusimicrobiota bacterium]